MKRASWILTAALLVSACNDTPGPFRTCADASAAGAAPLATDHPRWNPRLDRDHDGTACDR